MNIVSSLFCVVPIFCVSQALFEIPFLIYTLLNATTSETVNNTEAKSLYWQTYLPLFSEYSALFTTTSRQLVDCLSDGHEQTQSAQKYQPTFADIEARFTAISEKTAKCLKAKSTSTSIKSNKFLRF